ncbi:uncharacterized protein LOC125201697 [Salvia hispanica]|uniref:uncharacterized protein LOC125201697 n=1 Tax=Salvia hispanica TaxID=49212 RepID=UPI002009B20A|nr:uncharacterized protein LOC125201697 [Salvia hispanica]XP_047955869.1 uncharacterized protein LOC125201697 [Salvia hispanica]
MSNVTEDSNDTGYSRPLEGMAGVIALLGKMHEDTNVTLLHLFTRIGHEVDLSKTRRELFNLLGNIPDLSLTDKFVVCETLGGNPARLDLFMGLPDSVKPAYVLRVLKERGQRQE